jgi:hypothetical protein
LAPSFFLWQEQGEMRGLLFVSAQSVQAIDQQSRAFIDS